jgi:hypothetical protein
MAARGRPLSRRVAPTTRALLCELRGDAVGAAQCYAAAASEWGELGVPYELALARLGQGRCLMALGRAPDAAAPLREALDKLIELSAGPDIETARRLLARTGLS